MSKGIGSYIPLAIVTAILVIGLGSIGITLLKGIDSQIRYDTLNIAEGRLESVIYATNSLEKARVQVNFRGKYNISDEGGEKKIKYIVPEKHRVEGNDVTESELNPPVEFDLEKGRNSSFCITKNPNSNPILESGSC